MPPKNSGGSFKFPGGHKVFHTPAQTAFVRVVTPRHGQTDSRQNRTLVQVCLTSILNYNNQCSVASLRFHSLSELAHDYQ